MAWLRSFLQSNTPDSSNRLNQFIVVINYLPVGLVLAWVIWYQSIHRIEGIQWNEMAWFMGAMTAFYGTLFGMKAINKAQENKSQPTSSSSTTTTTTESNTDGQGSQ